MRINLSQPSPKVKEMRVSRGQVDQVGQPTALLSFESALARLQPAVAAEAESVPLTPTSPATPTVAIKETKYLTYNNFKYRYLRSNQDVE